MDSRRRATLKLVGGLAAAMSDPLRFGPLFGGPSWRFWRIVARTLFGEPLDADELLIFTQCTGRTEAPRTPLSELWLACGRRAGKSRFTALVAVWLAVARQYSSAPGERLSVLIVAPDRETARLILGYAIGLLRSQPELAELIATERRQSVDLTNGLTIEVMAASHRTTRGRTAVSVLVDEVCFLRSGDAVLNDAEILTAMRPSLMTTQGPLIAISSPYRRSGEMFNAFERYWGRDDAPVLCWRASSIAMNSSLDSGQIAAAIERDPQAGRSEWLAQWRDDVSGHFDETWLTGAVESGCDQRPPRCDLWRYVAHVDPSSGKRDSMAVAIAHWDAAADLAVLDCVHEIRPPFPSPAVAVKELAAVLRKYSIYQLTTDAYATSWVADAFKSEGITVRLAGLTTSDAYLDAIRIFASGRVRLLDNSRLLDQLRCLERHTRPNGKDHVTHPDAAHDDLAAATVQAMLVATSQFSHVGLLHVVYSEVAIALEREFGDSHFN